MSISAQNQTYYFQKMNSLWIFNSSATHAGTQSVQRKTRYISWFCVDWINWGRPKKSWNLIVCCALIILVSNLNYNRNYNLIFGLLIDGILLRPDIDFTTSWWWIKNWYLTENRDYINYLHFKMDNAAGTRTLFVYIVIAVIDQSRGAKTDSGLRKCSKFK